MSQAVATNKKAFHDYILTDKWECGVALNGAEVKSIRQGNVNFKDAFARVENDEVYLYNLHIEPYAQGTVESSEADRIRKLLLHRKEIKKIENNVIQRNLVLVPTKIYFNSRGLVKIELALGKGKKTYDKRETIKKRNVDRDISRAVRSESKRPR